jgi:F0F1-type ATP synthase delta subunit
VQRVLEAALEYVMAHMKGEDFQNFINLYLGEQFGLNLETVTQIDNRMDNVNQALNFLRDIARKLRTQSTTEITTYYELKHESLRGE